MTIPQIKGFMEAILRRTAMYNAVFISNVAVGAQCDSKTIKKTIKNYADQRMIRKKVPQSGEKSVKVLPARASTTNEVAEFFKEMSKKGE
jgi:hypothetical protein